MDRPSYLQTASGLYSSALFVSELELTDPIDMKSGRRLYLRCHQPILSSRNSPALLRGPPAMRLSDPIGETILSAHICLFGNPAV
jgi:hypothetical protein